MKRKAVAAANARKGIEEPLAWSEALSEAPFPDDVLPAWEAQFRKDYAARLVARGLAKKPAASGKSGKSGKTDLLRRTVYLSQEEIDAQDERARAANQSWSTWARRKLSQ